MLLITYDSDMVMGYNALERQIIQQKTIDKNDLR
jgi:hypothetical protein